MSIIDTILLSHLFGEKAYPLQKAIKKPTTIKKPKKPKKQKAKSQQKLFLAFCYSTAKHPHKI